MSLPDKWNLVKFDLFNNANAKELALDKYKLKLAMSFRIKDTPANEFVYFRAGLNSPLRHLKRGVTDSHDQAHYGLVQRTVEEIQAELGADLRKVRASKFYKKGYAEEKRTVGSASVVVWDTNSEQGIWNICLVIKQQLYMYRMNGANLTKKQRAQGVIASTTVKPEYKGYKMHDIEDYI